MTQPAADPRPIDLLWTPLAFLLASVATASAVDLLGSGPGHATMFVIALVANVASMAALALTKRRLPYVGRSSSVALMAAIVFGAVTLVVNKAVGEADSTPLELAVRELTQPGDLALAFVVVVLTAPIVEEGYFRGLLLPYLGRYVGPIGASVLAALVFALLHPGTVTFYVLFVMAFFWGVLAQLSQNLTAPLIGHMAVNAVSYAMLVREGKWAQSVSWVDVGLMGACSLFAYAAAGYWAARRSRPANEAKALTGLTLYSVGMAVLISITLASLIVAAPGRQVL